MPTVLIFSPDPLPAAALRQLLNERTKLTAEPPIGDLPQLLDVLRLAARDRLVDLVMIDFHGRGTLEVLRTVLRQVQGQPIVGVWARDINPQTALEMLHMGARGVISKTAPPDTQAFMIDQLAAGCITVEKSLGDAMVHVQNSQRRLTEREGQLLRLVTCGYRNKEIAAELLLSNGTVKVYLSRLFAKLRVNSRHELACWGLANGYDKGPPPPFVVPPKKVKHESVSRDRSPVPRVG